MLATLAVSRPCNCVPLTEDQIDFLCDQLDADKGERDRSRRRFPRHSWRTRVLIQVTEGDRVIAYEAPTRNISVSGLSILHGYMICPGQVLEVRFPGPGWSSREVAACVCHCRRVQGRVYEIGLRFVNAAVGEDLLEAFIRDDRTQKERSSAAWGRHPKRTVSNRPFPDMW